MYTVSGLRRMKYQGEFLLLSGWDACPLKGYNLLVAFNLPVLIYTPVDKQMHGENKLSQLNNGTT